MAENYLLFSEALLDLIDEEEAWLREQLKTIEEYGESCPRFLRDCPDFDPSCDTCGFDYAFYDGKHAPRGWGRHLVVYAEENGDPSHAAWLVQKFLRRYRPGACWAIRYATPCSKPRVGEFGGGAMFVTAADVEWQNAQEFIDEKTWEFEHRAPRRSREALSRQDQGEVMSGSYGMELTIRGYDPKRKEAIQETASAEWNFGDWSEDEDRLTSDAEGQLCGGETEEEFAERLAHAVWRANGGYCEMSVRAVYLEDLPTEEYAFLEDDYEAWQAESEDKDQDKDEDASP